MIDLKIRAALIIVLGGSGIIASGAYAQDTGHFWRPRWFWGEPRVESRLLQSYFCGVASGSTCVSRNSCGEKVPLFALYGPCALQHLGAQVPGLDPANALDKILLNLAALPERPGFGSLVFGGDFEVVEAYFDYYQNIERGFFVALDIPVRSFHVTTIRPGDLSPRDREQPNAWNPSWIAFLQSFDEILNRFSLAVPLSYHYVALGDTSVAVGWSHTLDVSESFDFFDTMIMVGGLLPTGRITPLDRPFEIPTGYNGFFGIATRVDCSFGMFDWLTSGLHVENIAFFNTTRQVRVRTDAAQQGLLKLAITPAKLHSGPLWAGGFYVKADHLIRGFSFLFAYLYERRLRDRIMPFDIQQFNPVIVNGDPTLCGFSQHLFNIVLEYDFFREECCCGPRLGFFYNHSISGKRIFITPMSGGLFGFDLTWNF